MAAGTRISDLNAARVQRMYANTAFEGSQDPDDPVIAVTVQVRLVDILQGGSLDDGVPVDIVSSQRIKAADGTAALPAFAFRDAPDMGMYRAGGDLHFAATATTGLIVLDQGVKVPERSGTAVTGAGFTAAGKLVSAPLGGTSSTFVVGDGSTPSFDLRHDFGTFQVSVVFRQISTNCYGWADVQAVNSNITRVTFNVVPSTDDMEVTITKLG